MTWIVFDCPSGISGDMTLGALVDAGVPFEAMRQALSTLPLAGYEVMREAVKRNSIAATRVHVRATRHENHHRHLHDVHEILAAGQLSARARGWARATFQRLAEAEAAVHRTSVADVHFHEVGAVDAIVDIAGACVGFDWLAETHSVTAFKCAQIRVGRGCVETEHGMMPVPVPAVIRLLEGFPVQWSSVDGERVTPTGAALLAALAQPLGDDAVRIIKAGYGAGSKEFADAPNLLRLLICEPQGLESPPPVAAAGSAHQPEEASVARAQHGLVGVLRTTIDDMIPEFFGHLMKRLFTAGALDVFYTPIYMKKGRPATEVTVIGEPDAIEPLAKLVLNETTTLGVRIAYEERRELRRHMSRVQTAFGEIVVKVAERPDGRLQAVPEYESVRCAAEAAGVPLEEVYRATIRAEGTRKTNDAIEPPGKTET